MNYFQASLLIILVNLFSAAISRADYVSDEELYRKAVTIEVAVKEMDQRIKQLEIEYALMNDVLKGLPTRIPASEIPLNKKGNPIVKIEKFKDTMRKVRKRELRIKIQEHLDEVKERKKTLARLKKERDHIFHTIKVRVRGMR